MLVRWTAGHEYGKRGVRTPGSVARAPPPARAVGRWWFSAVVGPVGSGGRSRHSWRAAGPPPATEPARLCAQPHHGLPIPFRARRAWTTPPPRPTAAHARCQNLGRRAAYTPARRRYPDEASGTSTAAAYKSDGTAKTLYHIHLSIHKRVDNRLVPAPQNSLLHSTYSSAAACYTFSLIDTTKTRHGKRRTKYY